MTQKVLKIGTSLGVTIPKQAVDRLGLRVGDSVQGGYGQDGYQMVIVPKSHKASSTRRRNKIAVLTANFIERYRSDLEALAHK